MWLITTFLLSLLLDVKITAGQLDGKDRVIDLRTSKVQPHFLHGSSCWSIPANGHKDVFIDGFGSASDDFFVLNWGTTRITAHLMWGIGGDTFYDEITSKEVRVGEAVHLKDRTNQTYGTKGLRINNRGNVRGYVQAYYLNRLYGWEKDEGVLDFLPKVSLNAILQTGASLLLSRVPVAGDILGALLDLFWPQTPVNYWSQIEAQVKKLVSEKIMELIKGILNNELVVLGERINILHEIIEQGLPRKVLSRHVLNTAEDTVGIHKKFIFKKEQNSNYLEVNWALLPYLGTLINIQMNFYKYCIINGRKLGLDEEDVEEMEFLMQRLVSDDKGEGVIRHFERTRDAWLAHIFETADANDLYNHVAMAIDYSVVHLGQFIPIWLAEAYNPRLKKRPLLTHVLYSTAYGRVTPACNRVAVRHTGMSFGINPKLFRGKRNFLMTITVHYLNNNRLVGLETSFKDGTIALSGRKGDKKFRLDTKEQDLVKVVAYGKAIIRALTFCVRGLHCTTIGNMDGISGEPKQVFYMPGHRICAIGAFSDDLYTENSLANVIVAYTPTENK